MHTGNQTAARVPVAYGTDHPRSVLLTRSHNSYCMYRHWASTRQCQWRWYTQLCRSRRILGRPGIRL